MLILENGKIESKKLNSKHILNLSHDNYTLTHNSLTGLAIKGIYKSTLDMDLAKKSRLQYIKYFGDKEMKMIDYWKDNPSKETFVEFLKVFGYDAVSILEDGIKT